MAPRGRSLCAAIALSLGLHVFAALSFQAPSRPGAAGAGAGGISVSLGPAGRAPGGEASVPTVARTEDVEAGGATPADRVPAEVAVPLVTAEPGREAQDPSDLAEASMARAHESELASSAAAATPRREAPNLRPVPRPPRRKPRPPDENRKTAKAATAKPEVPDPQVESKASGRALAEQVASGPTRDAGTDRQQAGLTPGQQGKAGTTGQSAAGSGNDTPGGGVPGAAADYYAEIQAWLQRHKRYPRRAKLRNEQGEALLRFVVTRAGQVTSFDIEKSSGHSLLDEEVGEMILRAQPLPKMPPEMNETLVELLIPVQFFLR